MPQSLGKIFKTRREKLGKGNRDFSVRKVASRAGISATYLSQLERGRISTPSEGVIKSLSSELKLNATDLILKSGQVSTELGDAIRSSPEEITDILEKIGSMSGKSLKSAVRELRETTYDWVPEVLDEKKMPNTVSNFDLIPPPQNPGNKETGRWGQEMASALLENLGYAVECHPEFTNSNALLVTREGIIPDRQVQFSLFPKTSKTKRQVRLGDQKFVANRQADQFYMAFMPKTPGVSVFLDPEIFLIPANTAKVDGLLANEVYEAHGGLTAGIIVKDIQREPHQSIMARWRRCFLYPDALDWLPQ